MIKEQITDKFKKELNNGEWGVVLNELQDKAEDALSKKEFNTYLIKSSKDLDKCEGMDGILLNGHYFDWREFQFKAKEIVHAWLDYFDPHQLELIYNSL